MSLTNEAIFHALHTEFRAMVLTICRGYMKGDLEQANDLTQDVFVNVWNALAKFRNEASHKTWIYRITVNTCLLQIRKSKKTTNVPINNALQAADYKESSQTENEQLLYHAIGKLDELDRLMIMMVLDELPYDEIAQIIGITENNLRVKIHIAKNKLKNLLEHEQRN